MSSTLFIREQDKQALLHIFKTYLPGVQVLVYGSRLTGEAHETSDLDVVVRSLDMASVPIAQLEACRSAIRQSTVPILVDLRDWASLPEAFHREIEKRFEILVEN